MPAVPSPQPVGAALPTGGSVASPLLAGYARRVAAAERFDELCLSDGSARPHWLPVLALLGETGPRDIESRLAGAQQHIRDEGH